MSAVETYVVAAYVVVFSIVLAYVLIIALKLQGLERTLAEVEAASGGRSDRDDLGRS